MLYHAYELTHAALTPWRTLNGVVQNFYENPLNPLARTDMGRSVAAACEVFEHVTKRYGKPQWGLNQTRIGGLNVPVHADTVKRKPFADLLHFRRDESQIGRRYDPKVLIVAPMSGHYATLLRGTVAAMLPEHDVYITDWTDARMVPLWCGGFDLDDYIDYIIEFTQFIGENTHIIGVCQPAVPCLAATALMNAREDPCAPASLTLMGGPIDTRRNPTVVNKLAMEKPLDWFQETVISTVPWPNLGMLRRVYPGFMQLTGFMTMNLDRHVKAQVRYFDNLVKGDCDSVQSHKKFYEEYLAVMDLTEEFFLQTVKTAFQDHALPKGEMVHRGERVDPGAITRTALMTVEGEKDDITGMGQTEAAQDLCHNIGPENRWHYVQPGVGHYGVFNGTRWRTEIQPRIREMIRTVQFRRRTNKKPAEIVSGVMPGAVNDNGAGRELEIPPALRNGEGKNPIFA